MMLVLRACVTVHKRFFYKDFSNLGRTLTYVACNSCSPKQFPVLYNKRCFSTEKHEEAAEGITEIYYGNLTRLIRNLKTLSLVTSASGLLFQPLVYSKAMESGNTVAVIGLFSVIGFFAISTPILLNFVTKKYVTHIYYDADNDEYIAKTYNLFVQTKEVKFTPKDVVVPDVNGMFTNCIIKGTPLFLQPNLFYDLSHYIKIMGYNKPIDFKLGNNSSIDQTVTTDTECKANANKK